VDEVHYFLDLAEEHLRQQGDLPGAIEILGKIEAMRRLAEDRTNNTTEITITLSDLFKSLHVQSSELSDLSNSLLSQMAKFKL
jgi:hypothetical protein